MARAIYAALVTAEAGYETNAVARFPFVNLRVLRGE
jgi:hypothetical protein